MSFDVNLNFIMIFLLTIFLIFFSLVNFIISKLDLLNPAFIFCSIFAVFSSSCLFVHLFTGLFEIENLLTLFILLIGPIIFTCLNLILAITTPSHTNQKPTFNSHILDFNLLFKFILFVTQLFFSFGMYKYVCDFASVYGVQGTFSEKLAFYDLITKFSTDVRLRMPPYVAVGNVFSRAICYILIYSFVLKFCFKRKFDLLVFLIIALNAATSLMSNGRTEVLRIVTTVVFMSAFFEMLKNSTIKFKLGLIFKFIFIAVFTVLSLSLLRDLLGREAYDFFKVIFGYMGAPIKNLDFYLSQPWASDNRIFGTMTFQKFWNWIGLKLDLSELVYTPVLPFIYFDNFRMGNVYTTYYPYYYDFGITGCIVILSIMSLYYLVTYYKLKGCLNFDLSKINIQIILYFYLLNDLLMSPFGARFTDTIVNVNFFRFMIFLLFFSCCFNKLRFRLFKACITK